MVLSCSSLYPLSMLKHDVGSYMKNISPVPKRLQKSILCKNWFHTKMIWFHVEKFFLMPALKCSCVIMVRQFLCSSLYFPRCISSYQYQTFYRVKVSVISHMSVISHTFSQLQYLCRFNIKTCLSFKSYIYFHIYALRPIQFSSL